MPIHNANIAAKFEEVADLLEIQDANSFRVRAYRSAARTLRDLPDSAQSMIEQGRDLTDLDDIGEDLAGKIKEIVETGDLEQLDRLEGQTPPELADLLDIPGLGPKRVHKLHKELGIVSREDLAQAVRQHHVQDVPGFGRKTEQKIGEALERQANQEDRTLLKTAEEVVAPLYDYLADAGAARQVTIAGSYRRRKETVGDIDIVATSDRPARMMNHFAGFEDVVDVVERGETRATVRLRSGLEVDLRVVAQESYGAALFYFTGSKAHNVKLRQWAVDRGLKVNEYGVFDGDDRIAGETETSVYEVFDLPVIPPELREDRGEIEAAGQGDLPDLVMLSDLRGDLQSHTTSSDGANSLEEMAEAARQRGYAYLAITDHSPAVAVAGGLGVDGLARQADQIDELNDRWDDFRLLKSCEVDIHQNGSLDLPDDILKRLDLCICSVHSHFDLSEDKQTERIIRAMDNPRFSILAHPTGRRIGQRQPYAVDMERLMTAALERGCYLEVNAQPERLDLDDVHCQMARDRGLKVSISTDAHNVHELDNMKYGVGQARRGWLSAGDVLNTRRWADLQPLLERS